MKEGAVKEGAVSTEKELRIGEVARRAGTTPRTIRYYEEIGLLPPADGRTTGAHRTYAESAVEQLTGLLQLKDLLGLSLEELKDLQAAEAARAIRRREWDEGVEDPVRRGEILQASLGDIERKLDLVHRRQESIGQLRDDLSAQAKRIRKLLTELD